HGAAQRRWRSSPSSLPGTARGGSGAFAAAHGDVVAAALRLVRTIRVYFVSFAGVQVAVVGAPGILVQLLDVLGHQVSQAVRPLAGLHVVQVDAVGDGLEIERGRLDLRLLQLAEDVVADGAGDQP